MHQSSIQKEQLVCDVQGPFPTCKCSKPIRIFKARQNFNFSGLLNNYKKYLLSGCYMATGAKGCFHQNKAVILASSNTKNRRRSRICLQMKGKIIFKELIALEYKNRKRKDCIALDRDSCNGGSKQSTCSGVMPWPISMSTLFYNIHLCNVWPILVHGYKIIFGVLPLEPRELLQELAWPVKQFVRNRNTYRNVVGKEY